MDLGEIGFRAFRCGLDLYHSGQGPVAGTYKHGSKPSSSIKGEKFRYQLRLPTVSLSRRTFLLAIGYLVINCTLCSLLHCLP
jgi:hypothetical protein